MFSVFVNRIIKGYMPCHASCISLSRLTLHLGLPVTVLAVPSSDGFVVSTKLETVNRSQNLCLPPI